MSTLPADRTPVIVGAGEVSDRPDDPLLAREPADLMLEALRLADADAGGGLLTRADSLDVVMLQSWRYADLPALVCERLGLSPARAVLGPVGGETPVRFLHEAARRIADGRSETAAIVGAEAQHASTRARRRGVTLPWTPFYREGPRIEHGASMCHPLADRLGVAIPTTVYPFYDAASAHAWGQTPAEALAESGALWTRYANAAARNPHAWIRSAPSAEEITTPTRDNRLIAWPYTRAMVANPNVNQGAALIVTSLARARAAGIAEDRLVHVVGGAAASEPRDYLARDQYAESHAQTEVLEAMLGMAGGDPNGLGVLELYSCFPCVPKMARRTLRLGAEVEPSVTGGLSFFGAPLNNYMTHAACTMVRRMREGAAHGLLYGQGEFVTKHHAVRLSREAPDRDTISTGTGPDVGLQARADARRGPTPTMVENAGGPATIESFTVLYDRDGAPTHGVAIVRLEDGARTLARIPGADTDGIAMLTAADASPVGRGGGLDVAADGISELAIAG